MEVYCNFQFTHAAKDALNSFNSNKISTEAIWWIDWSIVVLLYILQRTRAILYANVIYSQREGELMRHCALKAWMASFNMHFAAEYRPDILIFWIKINITTNSLVCSKFSKNKCNPTYESGSNNHNFWRESLNPTNTD